MEVSYLYLKEQWAPELDMREAMRIAPYLLLAVLQETIEYIASNFSPEFLTLVVVSISGFALYFSPANQEKEVRETKRGHRDLATEPASQACPILSLFETHAPWRARFASLTQTSRARHQHRTERWTASS